jgi:hypothetical protein
MVLGSTQPLIEMSTRNLPGGKGLPAHNADNLAAICESIVLKIKEPRRLTNLWASTAWYRDSFLPFLFTLLKFTNYSYINFRAERSGFGSRQKQAFSPLHSV